MPPSFTEYYHKKTGLTVGVNRVLFSDVSDYQKVEILETDTWGNLMAIDGMVMLSEKDEFVYHEMLSHVPLFSHLSPARVLVVGGGDGGTAREVLRHPSVQTVDLVEIDQTVVRAAKKFLPEVGNWQNPKLNVTYQDGTTFVKNIQEPYDVMIIDGSDPVGPAQGLFGKEFMQACYNALTTDGVLAAQAESPWIEHYHSDMQQLFNGLEKLYPISRMYLAHIPLYPSGMWSFALASKGDHPLSETSHDRVKDGLQRWGGNLKYYNLEIHTGSFALPNFVSNIIQ